MRRDVVRDWGWADGYLPEIRRILTVDAMHLFTFRVASYQQDVKQATDMLVTANGEMAIAVRIRRDYCQWRDLTIRAWRHSGVTTELDKIKDGHGDYYLYAWAQGFRLPEWMLVNLEALRNSGLLEQAWAVKHNKDGRTRFIAIPHNTLSSRGCIVASNVHVRIQRPDVRTTPVRARLTPQQPNAW